MNTNLSMDFTKWNLTSRPALTAWMLIERKTGNSVMVSKTELEVRIECEERNMKANREAFYVRPFDY